MENLQISRLDHLGIVSGVIDVLGLAVAESTDVIITASFGPVFSTRLSNIPSLEDGTSDFLRSSIWTK